MKIRHPKILLLLPKQSQYFQFKKYFIEVVNESSNEYFRIYGESKPNSNTVDLVL